MKQGYKSYIIFTYLFFWVFIGITGIVLLKISDDWWVEAFMVMLCSWVPTVVLMVMFRRLMPGTSRREFYQPLFFTKINWLLLLSVTGVQLIVFLVSVALTATNKSVTIGSLINTSAVSFLISFFINLLQGASGEESGWRGYLQPIMEEKYGLYKGSILVGVLQGCWHTPLWFLSGYTGKMLIWYISSFMLCIASFSLIVGVIFHINRNLAIPVWLHLIFNLTVSGIFIGDVMDIFPYLAIGYFATAIAIIIWHGAYKKKRTIILAGAGSKI